MKKDRIIAIDSIKGIACLVIAFLWHYLNMQPKGLGMPLQFVFGTFYDYGQYFVELFFMISGFVMAYCYKQKIVEGENFLPYMAKRYKHLYPLFFVTLMYMVFFQVFYYALTGTYYVYKVSAWHLILNLLCIQNGWFTTEQSFNGPAWCVSIEIFLYILFYISTKLSKKDNNRYVIISGAFFLLGTVFVYWGSCDYPILNMFMMRGVSCFYGGVLICELNERLDIEKKKKLATTVLILWIIFRVALNYTDVWSFWDSENTGRMMLILIEWPIIIFSGINCPIFRKCLEVKPLQFLGTISMDVFLWHVPVQITIKTIDKLFELNIDYGEVYIWIFYIFIVLVVAYGSNNISKHKKNEHYLLNGIITIAICGLMLFITDMTGIQMKAYVNSSLSYSDMDKCIEMAPGYILEESFYVTKDTKLRQIQFYTITWNRSFSDDQIISITIREKDNKEVIYQAKRRINSLRDASTYDLQLEEPIEFKADTWYVISYETNTNENQETMALITTDKSNNNGVLYLNGNTLDSHISQIIWTKK